ncbi:hypothetical protein [Saccharopolyspora phatthalungensis]|uniref:Uncharacterized protein n=1 Tax=Saccharopolyspora phatthalungensis TaxID=664693 RepID=A0A840QIX8_9PSEU|nr:hypothetical protein [Saccharopolyspora phatthalungensis]MBB5157443.1 hypothetical protein [Saccharopolyspora phatthalungensis]
MITDETTTGNNHTYVYIRTVRTPTGSTVRATVHRDFYPHQSFALAQVLTHDMTWTDLTFEPPEQWWDTTPVPRDKHLDTVAELAPIAEKLIDRALIIIGDPPHPAQH